jgi:hypothetical protein
MTAQPEEAASALFEQWGNRTLAGFRLATGSGCQCEFSLYPIK